MPVGQVGWTEGPLSAASDRFAARIIGRQGHAAAPHQTVDPVVIAAQVVLAWQAIISRTVPPLEAAVLTTGMIHGGDRENIIPAEVELRGTVRTHNEDLRGTIERRMREVALHTSAAAGATAEFEYRRGYPANVNDSSLARRMRPVLGRAVGGENVAVRGPELTGEDFAFLARETPGFYFGLGTLAPGTTSGPHHSPTFRADDAAIPVGMRAMAFVLVAYLGGGR
jgi:amidohydrolase